MVITPDPDNTDNIIRYYEELHDDYYFYELYVVIDGIKSAIIVTKYGVSVDNLIIDSTIHTNIDPSKLYPEKKELSWNELNRIVILLQRTSCEGKSYSASEMRSAYNKWKNSQDP